VQIVDMGVEVGTIAVHEASGTVYVAAGDGGMKDQVIAFDPYVVSERLNASE